MHEIELKLQVPTSQRAALDAAVAGRAPAPRLRLQAAYFDTPERALALAGLALRLRREGRQWVQTLKGAGDDAMTRAEHNVPRGTAAAMPPIDTALHAGVPVGERLTALLTEAGPLQSLFSTDVRRRSRALVVRAAGRPQARVELAFDTGRIEAGEASIEVCEFEVELLTGTPLAVIDTARRWQGRFGLWLDSRSKAERGDLLARGERVAAPRTATRVQLEAAMAAPVAWQTVLRNCAEQILANASQIASGEHGADHVHQLRVGLRRLRSAVALFEVDAGPVAPGAAAMFRGLGAARDSVVIEGEFGAELLAAMRGAGLTADHAPAAPRGTGPAPAALVRAPAGQGFLLDLITAMHAPASGSPLGSSRASAPRSARVAPPGSVLVSADASRHESVDVIPRPSADVAPAWRERLAARLDRWHRQVARGAAKYATLDDEARHSLRKRAKRLRYAAEFCGALFGRRKLRRYLKALRALQERLGAVSDVSMAMQAFAARASADAHAMFALGWLAARREVMVAAAVPELKAFTKTERFWK